MAAPVVIVDYDPQWPALYEGEKRRILAAIGRWVVGIEHIGSTAVPELGAKPIIDIMVAVARLGDAAECVAPLQSMGYEYVPDYEVIIPERRFFRKGLPEGRTHHLHAVEMNGDFWDRHLRFRDYLRSHPEEVRQYDLLKRELAQRFRSDRDAYTEAKTRFIEGVVAKARAAEAAGL